MVLSENQKIGVGLISLGAFFVFLGVVLFLDAGLIAIGNVLFLTGIVFSIGIKRTVALFSRRDRIAGAVLFFLGILLVLFRWSVVGLCVETFGFINLFGDFLPTIVGVARQVPVLSSILNLPGISHVIDLLLGKTLPKYSV